MAHMHHLDVFRVTRSKLSSYASGKCNIIRPNKDISLEQPGNQLASLSIYQSQLVTVGLLASEKGKPSLSPSIHLYGTILTMEMRVSVIHINLIIILSLSEKY